LGGGATTEFWQNALSVANSMAMARMVLFGIVQSKVRAKICAGRRLQYRMRAFNTPIRGAVTDGFGRTMANKR
jgi:hypothetical protein